MSLDWKALEAEAREVAAVHGCTAIKSTKRLPVDGGGGFQLIDNETCLVRAGKAFNLSAQQVIQFFEGEAQ